MLSVIEIGEKIAVARKMKNLSQAQLAATLSVSAQAVGKWERGESMPDIIMFQQISETLGVDLNYFSDNNTKTDLTPMPENPIQPISDLDKEEIIKPSWNMSSSNWIDMDFSGLAGLAEKFNSANIENCKFIASELSGLQLRRNNIKRSDFTKSDMRECSFSNSNLENDIFIECDFSKSEFVRSNIIFSDFTKANLTNVKFKFCNIRKTILTDAVLYGSIFQYGQFTELVFNGKITDCAFENNDFSKIEFNGAEIRNTFFKNCKLKRANFINCKADKLSYAFMKACKADLSDVEIVD